uniref:uncharacterized protein LOC101296990 n=1 Tax=Fragaria vesca subsp. vesca TaxID=101020 RepID=UPI0005C84205|nr:PREDICTED: uncharacterized protein LOC101296990 [Fragaria vesca subsp. vesca]
MSNGYEMGRTKPTWVLGNNIKEQRDSVFVLVKKKEEKETDLSLSHMIGRKIRCAGKSKSSDYEEFKMSIRVARRLRRVRRARKARNGWMFGRKIRTGRQFIRPIFLDCETSEPKIVTFVDKNGVEQTWRMYNSSYPRPKPKVVKPPEPGYGKILIIFQVLYIFSRNFF